MKRFLNGDDDPVRKYAKECFERTLDVVRAGGAPEELNAIPFVHDTLRIAREIAESVFGENTTSDDIFRVYDLCKRKNQRTR